MRACTRQNRTGATVASSGSSEAPSERAGRSPAARHITYTELYLPFRERNTHLKHWLMGAAVLVSGLILANSPAGAFPPGAPPQPRVVRPGTLPPSANPLNLTPAQQQKLTALTTKMMPDIQKAMQGAKTPAEARKKMMAIQKKMEPQIMKVLTPAQQKKYRVLEANAVKREKEFAAAARTAPKK